MSSAAKELLCCRNNLHLDGFLRLLRNLDGLGLRLILTKDLGIGESKRVYVIPRENLVVTGRDALERELPILICSASLEELAPLALPIRGRAL